MVQPHRARFDQTVTILFVLGLLATVLAVSRGQVESGDQLNLLARGWMFAFEGTWIQVGNPTSSGGVAPGGITSLLVGLPLMLWKHHRAPVVVIALFHLLAWWILDRLLRTCVGRRERVFFAILFWIAPWRIYLSGFLWNPNFLFLFGAVHAATAYRMRHRPDLLATFLHVASIGLAFQLHASAVLLAAASGLLYLRGYIKVHWPAWTAGVVLQILLLVPWVMEVARQPDILPVSKGFPFRGLLYVYPLERGLEYWIRYSSLYVSQHANLLDFTTSLGARFQALAATPVYLVTRILLSFTVILPLCANIRLWRRARRGVPFRRFGPAGTGRQWLTGYARWTFVGAFLTFCLAPTTIRYWQVALIMHAAVLPLVLWAGTLARSRRRVAVRRIAIAYAAASLFVVLVNLLGGPHYRCPVGHDKSLSAAWPHPMFEELHIGDQCRVPIGGPDAVWPDVFPAPEKSSP